jgi:gas vesicle protein
MAKNGRYFIAGAILGGLIGAAVALLTAPRTGRELREELGKNLETAKVKGKDLYVTLKNQAEELIEKASDAGIEFSGRWLELPLNKKEPSNVEKE